MNRRRFLSLLSKATAGAAVAYSFPSIIVPKNIRPVEQEYPLAFRGLAHIINSSNRILTGYHTVTFPDLNSPVVDLKGVVLTRQMFDAAKRRLNAYYYGTGDGTYRGIEWPFASR